MLEPMKPAVPMQECQFSWHNATVERQDELKTLLTNISTAVRAIISCLSCKFTSMVQTMEFQGWKWKFHYGYVTYRMFSIIIWSDLVVYRTRKTSFGGQTPFIGFNSAFTITISTWAVFGVIHLFRSCPTRGNLQFGSCRMAIVNIHKTLSHNKVHERTSSNEIP